jgi:uncharacterized protein DUF6980
VVFYLQSSTGKIVSMSVHCCDRMDLDLNYRCDRRANRNDCPDTLVKVIQNRYFLIVHDGGSSGVEINFARGAGTNCREVNAVRTSSKMRVN